MNNQNLKLQNQIEQLEKRVSSIRTTDLSQVYQTIQTSSQDIQSLNNSFENLSTSLNTISDSLENLSSNISYNDLQTLNLSRDVSDDFNTTSQTEYFFASLQERCDNVSYMTPWYFVVGLGQVVSGKVSICALHYADTTVYSKLLLNGQPLSWAMGCTNANGDAMTIEFDFSFVPTQKNNSFSFDFEETTNLCIFGIKIQFTSGNNPIMLNYTNQNQIAMFDDTLYIYKGFKTTTQSMYFYKMDDITIQDKDLLTFTTSSVLCSLNNEKIAMLNDTDWTVAGKSNANKNTIGVNINGTYSVYNNNVTEAGGISIASSPTPYTCSTITNTSTKYKYVHLSINQIADVGPKLYASKGKIANACTLKYNDQDLPCVFVDVQAVLPMGTTELDDGDVFYGYVAVRQDGECIYFPDFNSSYYIKLGFGRNPFCYISGGEITITLGGKNFCKRIVLSKNTSGVYAVEEQYFYRGIDHLYPINNEDFVFVRKSDTVSLDKKSKYFFKKDIQSIIYTDVSTQSEG